MKAHDFLAPLLIVAVLVTAYSVMQELDSANTVSYQQKTKN